MKASEARELTTSSDAFLKEELNKVYEIIRQQAGLGNSEAHIWIAPRVHASFFSRLVDELILKDYSVKVDNENKTITVKW